MTTESDDIGVPRSLPEAQELIDRLRQRSDEDYHWPVLEIIQAARLLGDHDPGRIKTFLVASVLPACLYGDEHTATASNSRRILYDWLTDLPDALLDEVRDCVLVEVIASLKELPTANALYTLATIGYRTNRVMSAFRRVGDQENRLGHEAIRMLLGLEPSRSTRAWIVRRLESSPTKNWTDELLNTAAQLGDLRFLPQLVAAAVKPETWFPFHRFGWLADLAPDNPRLQQQVWQSVTRVLRRRPEGWREFLVAGGVVGSCNTPEVVKWLWANLPRTLEETTIVHFERWAERIWEVRTIDQLRGTGRARWDVATVLQPLVEQHDTSTEVAPTIDAEAKLTAIEVSLASGQPSALTLPDIALKNETNPLLRASLLDRIAVLSLPDLPSGVRESLAQAGGFTRGAAGRDGLIVFLASCRCAASSAHIESLALILRSNGSHEGHAFTAPVNAAAQQAAWLYRDRRESVDEILRDSTTLANVMGRSTAARSYMTIAASNRELSPAALSALEGWALNPGVEPYVRRDALRALVLQGRRQTVQRLGNVLSVTANDSDAAVAAVAIAGLVSLGLTDRARQEFETRSGQRPKAPESSKWAAELLGRLAAGGDARDVASALEIFADGDEVSVESCSKGFLEQVVDGGQADARMIDALISRIRIRENRSRANTEIFARLAKVAPERLIREEWHSIWGDWMSNSRQSLASAIAEAVNDEADLRSVAAKRLVLLLADGSFSVRRAAGRALAQVDVAALESWCNAALNGGSIALRRAGADAAAWLPPSTSQRRREASPLGIAQRDEERVVRESASRSQRDCRLRRDASRLLEQVVMPRQDGNEWVLSAYAAGRALSLVGDDADIRVLESVRATGDVPPNVRHWLGRISEGIEKNWRKRVEEWPEPSAQWRGALEEVEAELVVASERIRARISLWRREVAGDMEREAWGGGIWTLGTQGYRLALAGHEDEIEIRVPGRGTARAWVETANEKRVLLRGNGAYLASSQG